LQLQLLFRSIVSFIQNHSQRNSEICFPLYFVGLPTAKVSAIKQSIETQALFVFTS
jgi:hypothetical protein